MKLQILSDLHLEFLWNKLNREDQDTLPNLPTIENLVDPSVDVVVLAGDISTAYYSTRVYETLTGINKRFIYVPGNHEFNHAGFFTHAAALKALYSKSNVSFLYNDYFLLDNIAFIGTPLWSKLDNNELTRMPFLVDDFVINRGMTTEVYEHEHFLAKQFLNWSVSYFRNRGFKVVVVTHMAPSFKSNSERFANSAIKSYFCNDMDVDVACLEPVLWVHGHTHDSLDYMIEKTRVICNPYGYYGTDTGMVKDFNPSFIVEI